MQNDEKMQEIEDFLTGRLTEEEKEGFRQKMQADPSLALEVDLYREILQGVTQQGRSELKQRLQHLESQLQRAEKDPQPNHFFFPPSSWKWLGGVAATVVLSLTTYLTLFKAPSEETLFARYYQPYPNVIATLERGQTNADAKAQALQLYEYQQYAAALPQLQGLLATAPAAEDLLFYTALTHVGLGQYPEALSFLEKIAEKPDWQFNRQARWYLALVHLKTHQKEAARQQLRSLLQSDDIYARQSRQLLNELE